MDVRCWIVKVNFADKMDEDVDVGLDNEVGQIRPSLYGTFGDIFHTFKVLVSLQVSDKIYRKECYPPPPQM